MRDHKLYRIAAEITVTEWEPDPEAPGGGEMVRTGRTTRETHTILVVAPSEAVATAWVQERFKSAGGVLKGVTAETLDGVLLSPV